MVLLKSVVVGERRKVVDIDARAREAIGDLYGRVANHEVAPHHVVGVVGADTDPIGVAPHTVLLYQVAVTTDEKSNAEVIVGYSGVSTGIARITIPAGVIAADAVVVAENKLDPSAQKPLVAIPH